MTLGVVHTKVRCCSFSVVKDHGRRESSPHVDPGTEFRCPHLMRLAEPGSGSQPSPRLSRRKTHLINVKGQLKKRPRDQKAQ